MKLCNSAVFFVAKMFCFCFIFLHEFNSLAHIGLFRFSVSSAVRFGKLYFSMNS